MPQYNGVLDTTYLMKLIPRGTPADGMTLLVQPAGGLIGAKGAQWVKSGAEAALFAASVLFKRRTGKAVYVLEAWRSMETQVEYKRRQNAGTGNLAATPGQSNHGWGLSFDLASGIDQGGEAYRIFKECAEQYGLRNDVPSEKWHWTFYPLLQMQRPDDLALAGGGATPFPTTPDQEEDDMPLTDNDLERIRDFLWESRVFVAHNGSTATVTMKEALGQAWMGGRDSIAALPQVKRVVDETTKTNTPLIYKGPNGAAIMAQPVVLDIATGNGTGMTPAEQLARAARQGAQVVTFAEQADFDQWRIMLLAGK